MSIEARCLEADRRNREMLVVRCSHKSTQSRGFHDHVANHQHALRKDNVVSNKSCKAERCPLFLVLEFLLGSGLHDVADGEVSLLPRWV